MWGLIDKRAREQVRKLAPAPRESLADAGERLRKADAAGALAQQTRARGCRRQPVAHGAEVAGAPALQGEAGDGAGDVGCRAQRAAQVIAQRLVLAQKGNRVETCRDRDGIAQRARKPGGLALLLASRQE